MIDRIEYLMRLTHDHCDDGDAIATRQMQERIGHVDKTEKLLVLARGLVSLLEDDLRRFGPSVPQRTVEQPAPPRQLPVNRPRDETHMPPAQKAVNGAPQQQAR